MSIDGAADSVVLGHAHGNSEVQAFADVGLDATKVEQKAPDADHCERCCHGHTAGISNSVTAMEVRSADLSPVDFASLGIDNFGTAPPTPPPNA